MKKFLTLLILCVPLCLLFCACNKSVDYFLYVSENRDCVYLLNEDDFELKIYSSEKETPYLSDGIKGKCERITEVFFKPKKTPNEVQIFMDGCEGEMNYMAVTQSFYISFTGKKPEGGKLEVKLICDGEILNLSAANVSDESAIGAEGALRCVLDYDRDAFEKLTNGNNFEGEIYVRLICDDGGCYYFVGLCRRDGGIHAYLVDGVKGRVIAEKESGATS